MAEQMDHAAVREWIDDAFLAPGMREDDDPTARAVRAHLAACADCGTYDEATRRVALKLDMARGPSPEVRTRTLAAARRLAEARSDATPAAGSRAASGARRGLTWRLAALLLVVAVAGAGAGAWWASAARQDSDRLGDAVAMMSTLAMRPDAQEVVLRDAAGQGNGIALMSESSHELAVFATHLADGIEYHCYLEHAGQRVWIGTMYVADGVQYWAGTMELTDEMAPGDVLIVAPNANAPAVLRASL